MGRDVHSGGWWCHVRSSAVQRGTRQCASDAHCLVDYQQEFSGTDIDAWDEEYDDHVLAVDPFQAFHTNRVAAHFDHDEIAPAHVSEVLDEWFAQHEDIDLFPDNEEEDKWNRYLAAAD